MTFNNYLPPKTYVFLVKIAGEYRQFLKEVEKYARKSRPLSSTIKLMRRDYDFGSSSELYKEDEF